MLPQAPAGNAATGWSWQARLLCLICTLDLLSSAWWFHHGQAVEANPLLQPALALGVVPFAGVKLLTFLPAIAAAEWHGGRFFRCLLGWIAGLYVVVYGAALLSLK